MKLRLVVAMVVGCGLAGASVQAQAPQPPGAAEALQGIASEHAMHSAFTFDRDMLQSAAGFLGDANGPAGQLDSITVENYRYRESAFYVPENVHALMRAYNKAGWIHLVDQNAPPKQSAAPTKPLTDLWLHFQGAEIDEVTVLVRGTKQMSVIEVAGLLKPLDLLHLSGHFGIPKVDSGAVMGLAPPEK